jgi:hypothetical protein
LFILVSGAYVLVPFPALIGILLSLALGAVQVAQSHDRCHQHAFVAARVAGRMTNSLRLKNFRAPKI